jgi:hypothetical protein
MCYKIKSLLLATTLAVLMSTSMYGQFTRNNSIDLVLNTILAEDTVQVDVFASFDSLADDVILIDDSVVVNPYSVSWVFFVDDNPFEGWYHKSRVIFFKTLTGQLSKTKEYKIKEPDLHTIACNASPEFTLPAQIQIVKFL